MEMTLNYEQVSKEQSFKPFVRTLALDLQENPYLSVGDFFKTIDEGDLNFLMEMGDQVAQGDETNPRLDQVMLIVLMLSNAEGLDNDSVEDCAQRMSTLFTLSVLESLGRKGLVNLQRENMSLGKDASQLTIATPVDGMDYKGLTDGVE